MTFRKYSALLKLPDWNFIALVLIAATFVLPFRLSNLVLVIAVLTWALTGNIFNKIKTSLSKPVSWPILAFFLLHLIALLYSHNQKVGLFAIEKKLPLLIFPLIVYAADLKVTQHKLLLRIFAWSIVAASAVLLVRVAYFFFIVNNCSTCFYHDFSNVIHLHAVYFSYYAFLAALILLQDLARSPKLLTFTAALRIFAVGILLSALIFAASKLVIVSLFLLLPLYLILSFSKFKIKAFLATAVFITAAVLLITSVDIVQDRFNVIAHDNGIKHLRIVGTNEKLSNDEKRELTGFSLRLLLVKLGLHGVDQQRTYLLGFSPGDAQETLDRIYKKHNLAPRWFEGYNLHNQYAQTFFELGLIGLIILLSMVVSLIASASYASSQQHLLLIFAFLICFAFLSEVVLATNKGIMFFGFFYTLLTAKPTQNT
ncbi:O-antigen ligase family protein [Pontibacter mangrovi]|uniref:O-antigen ligase-related domain-containing protein n=1 Tax=Pontibacter mangrovi TaxID=2589816 RepID=A0A501WCM2_9BACT|nr:O-antigen ligase family protein [Pontibacter mangrovi]TPE46130.1 hypothetical protein FJM65_01930 [Pontibacter mangrovi]